jgi:glycosyltransferase involved in cell wall biosynthesis
LIVFIYIVLVFLILRFSVTVFNFLSNPKLGHYGKKFDDKVSLIISTSSVNLPELLKSISAQDYKNIEILHVDPKEDLAKAALSARGKYLLFLDSDCIIKNGLLNSLIYRTKVFNLKFLVLIPNRSPKTFLDYLLQPIPDFVVLNTMPLRLIRLVNLPALVPGNDRYLFYDADGYRAKHNGDLADKRDKKVETLLANGMLLSNQRASVRNITKDLVRIFDGNLIIVIIYLTLLVAGPIVLLANFEFAFVSLPIGLIFLTRIMSSFLTRQNPIINIILHPIQMVVLTGLLLAGIFKRLFTS